MYRKQSRVRPGAQHGQPRLRRRNQAALHKHFCMYAGVRHFRPRAEERRATLLIHSLCRVIAAGLSSGSLAGAVGGAGATVKPLPGSLQGGVFSALISRPHADHVAVGCCVFGELGNLGA